MLLHSDSSQRKKKKEIKENNQRQLTNSQGLPSSTHGMKLEIKIWIKVICSDGFTRPYPAANGRFKVTDFL